MARPRRKRQEWEARFASEYVNKFFPQATTFLHLRLGVEPQPAKDRDYSESEKRALRVYMRWADAVIVLPTEIKVIEAKLRPAEYPRGIAQLEIYQKIVPHTPELQPFLPRDFKMRLVVAVHDPVAEVLCREKGFEYHAWEPPWYRDYLTRLAGRTLRVPRGVAPGAPEEKT